MQRYFMKPDSDRADWEKYRIFDHIRGAAETRYAVATCRDPDMAQKIIDLLNAEPAIEELVAEVAVLKAIFDDGAKG